jgi:hypothetical protein
MKKASLFFLYFLISISSVAQPGGGGDPGDGEPVPIAGLGILIAAGAFFGVKKIYDSKNKH